MLVDYTNNTLTYLPDEAVRGVMKLLLPTQVVDPGKRVCKESPMIFNGIDPAFDLSDPVNLTTAIRPGRQRV